MRRTLFLMADLAAVLLLLVVAMFAFGDAGGLGGGLEANGRASEIEEQAEQTQDRLEALAVARAAGTLGVTERIVTDPAPGWAGEQIMNETGDDWEPAIAADPNAPFVYVLHNRYGGEPACAKGCPDPAMILRVSRDGGNTWGGERYLCVCKGFEGQYDPLIEVVPETGDVYAAWMNRYNIHFSRSTDHGRTWSEAVSVQGDLNWGDKPNMTMTPDGQDVYVMFNGPTGGDVHAAFSHDFGETWETVRVTNSERYYFNYGGVVLRNGDVLFGNISFSYTGPQGAPEGPIMIHVISSGDDGATWTDVVVDELEVGSECTSRGCYEDYHDSGPSLTADQDDDLVLVYNGAHDPLGPRRVYARSSKNGGQTWSDRVRISRRDANAAYPAAVAEGNDTVRVWFMDQRRGYWNVRYRTSTDLGATWTKPLRISDARSGTAYKTRAGFLEAYGDYGEIAITNTGKTVAVWGEGNSYIGPGGIWFNREV